MVGVAEIKREAKILRMVPHDNIMKWLATEVSDIGKTVTAVEFCDGGNLLEFIEANSNGLPSDDFFDACDSIFKAISYLYKANVIHRDIKPENIMISKSSGHKAYKLVDFGAAKVLKPGQRYGSLYGTHEYWHPDIFGQFYYSKLAQKPPTQLFGYTHELWSIGITISEMACGCLPFQTPNGREDVQKMYDMIAQKPDGVIAIDKDGKSQYCLPETCNVDDTTGVSSLIAGLLKTKEMWSMEQFETEMATVISKAKQRKQQKQSTAKKSNSQKENRNHKNHLHGTKNSSKAIKRKPRRKMDKAKMDGWKVGKSILTKNQIRNSH